MLTIDGSSKEIGGTCIELQARNSRILVDFGLPLVTENKQPFDFREIESQSRENLIKQGVLPGIKL